MLLAFHIGYKPPWNDWISFRHKKPSGVPGYHIKTYTYWAMNVTDNLSSDVDIGSNLCWKMTM